MSLNNKIYNPELVRPLDKIMDADPRWEAFGFSISDKSPYTKTLEDYARPIHKIILNESVPENVKVHFETAKNLALYAWYVYRFNSVAELHAFISVEFALREKTKNKNTHFKTLFKEAIDKGWFSNEKFSEWKIRTERQDRDFKEHLAFSKRFGETEPTEPEYWDYIEVIRHFIPTFRNSYAHGSSSIRPWILSSLVLSSEIINQIYPDD